MLFFPLQVRLPLLSPSYIFDTVCKVGVVSETPRAMSLVMEALELHVLPDRKESARIRDWLKPRACSSKVQVGRDITVAAM